MSILYRFLHLASLWLRMQMLWKDNISKNLYILKLAKKAFKQKNARKLLFKNFMNKLLAFTTLLFLLNNNNNSFCSICRLFSVLLLFYFYVCMPTTCSKTRQSHKTSTSHRDLHLHWVFGGTNPTCHCERNRTKS